MPPFHLSSTSRALYRVFIAPSTPIRILQPALFIPCASKFLPQTAIRTKVFSRKDTNRHQLSDAYVFDKAINADFVHLIDLEGNRHPFTRMDRALRMFDSGTHLLLQVTEGGTDAYGNPDPDNPPTAKITNKMDLRMRHKKKMEIASKAAKIADGGAKKQLELNWAIGANDLNHRLKKFREMLEQGRKVEILLAPKRKGKAATTEECEDVLKRIRDVASDCKGTGEMKEPEGKIGAAMTLVFQGKKIEKKGSEEE